MGIPSGVTTASPDCPTASGLIPGPSSAGDLQPCHCQLNGRRTDRDPIHRLVAVDVDHRLDLSCSCLGSGSCTLLSHIPGVIGCCFAQGPDAAGAGHWLVFYLEARAEWRLANTHFRLFPTGLHGLLYTVDHALSITRGHQIKHRPDRVNLDSGAFCAGVRSSILISPDNEFVTSHALD